MAVERAVVFSSGAVGMSRCGEKGWKKHSVEVVDLGVVLGNAEGFAMVGRRLVVWAWVRLGLGVWKKIPLRARMSRNPGPWLLRVRNPPNLRP